MKRIIATLLAVTAVALAGWSLSRATASAEAAEPSVEPTATGESFEAWGLSRPSRRIELALRVPGVIAARPVGEGDRVKTGDLVAELNSDVEKASLEISRLKASSDHEVQAAIMSERQALVELGRVEDLLKREMATKWEYEEAKVQADVAKVRTEYARFQQKMARLELQRDEMALKERQLRAPFAGVIVKPQDAPRLKDVGDAVQELTPVAELLQLDPLLVELNLPRQRFGQVKPGAAAVVQCEGRSAPARVVMCDPAVDAASETFRVRVELSNNDGVFTAGLKMKVTFSAGPAVTAAATQPDDRQARAD